MKPKRSFFRTFVAPVIAGIAIIPTVLIAVRAVLNGRAADSYRNVYGLAIPTRQFSFSSGFSLPQLR